MSAVNARVSVREPAIETSTAQFAEDVRYYLSQTPRQLPSRYLYDPLGSALFDAICQLPWYRLTRAETRLLATHAAEVFSVLAPLSRIVELGSGSGEKLVTLLNAAHRHPLPVHLHLVDISTLALETACARAERVRGCASRRPIRRRTRSDSRIWAASTSPAGDRWCCSWDRTSATSIRPGRTRSCAGSARRARQGDGFLIGADLVKPEHDLLLAYDDPLGVTAAFNRNLLARINRELGADFDLAGFAHRAVWNGEASRIEMHLVSTRLQHIHVPDAQVELVMNEGDTIWTESSYKYHPHQIVAMLERNGFALRRQWIDPTAQFALTLVEAK